MDEPTAPTLNCRCPTSDVFTPSPRIAPGGAAIVRPSPEAEARQRDVARPPAGAAEGSHDGAVPALPVRGPLPRGGNGWAAWRLAPRSSAGQHWHDSPVRVRAEQHSAARPERLGTSCCGRSVYFPSSVPWCDHHTRWSACRTLTRELLNVPCERPVLASNAETVSARRVADEPCRPAGAMRLARLRQLEKCAAGAPGRGGLIRR
jgi:hypothetical protein